MSRRFTDIPLVSNLRELIRILNDRLRRLDSETAATSDAVERIVLPESGALTFPGPVTINTGGITKTYFTDPATRERRVKVAIPWTAPPQSAWRDFAGVETWQDAPPWDSGTPLDPTGGDLWPHGWHGHDGTIGGPGLSEFIAPAPSRQEAWRFYLASRTRDAVPALRRVPEPDATTNVLVIVDPSPAVNVTSFTAGPATYAEGDRAINIPYSFTLPAGASWEALDWDYCQIEIQTSSMGPTDKPVIAAVFDRNTGSPGTAVQSLSTFTDLPTISEQWTLSCVSYDTRGNAYSSAPTQLVTVNPPPAITSAPTQITEATISIVVSQYATDPNTGKQMGKVVVTFTPPGDGSFAGIWVYEGVSPPGNPATAVYVDGSPWYSSSTGAAIIEFWLERKASDTTYWGFVTNNNADYFVTPSASTPKKSFVVTAVHTAPQVTGFSVTVDQQKRAGVWSGRYRFNFTKPSDPEFWYASIERVPTDASFTPLGGFDYGRVAGEENSSVQKEWWPLPKATPEYWKFRSRSVNQADKPNDVSPPTYNVTVPTSAGLDLGESDPSSLQTNQLEISGGKAGVSANLIDDTVTSRPIKHILTLNSIRVEIASNLYGSWYAGIALINQSFTSQRISLMPAGGGIWVEDSTTKRTVVTGAPAINLIDGTTKIAINGVAGDIDTVNGYKVGGVTRINSSGQFIPAGGQTATILFCYMGVSCGAGSLTFSNGILTGYVSP